MNEKLDAPYARFAAALRTGTFRTPESGWPAELIAAHVAMVNDGIAGLAEQVAAGAEPGYDNSAAVDEARLRAFADTAGGLRGLADAVERSAARLAAAYDALRGELGDKLVQVLIHDGGGIAADRPMPIRSFCEETPAVICLVTASSCTPSSFRRRGICLVSVHERRGPRASGLS